MRLIDKNALIERIKKRIPHMIPSYDGTHLVSAERMVEFIEDAPTVEAKEVVHGKWIDGCCSNCGAYVPTDSGIDFIDEEDCKFCYECGCDMRG